MVRSGRLRSANLSNSYNAYNVNTTGYISYNHARIAYASLPD